MPRFLDNWLLSYRNWTVPRSEAPESLIIWAGLFTLASVAKRHIFCSQQMMGGYSIYPSLYIIFVGPAGVIRKSTTIAYSETLLRQVEHINIAPDGMSASMLIGSLCETVDGSMSVISSEFGTFIQTSKEDMYDILSALYDGKVSHDYETRLHGPEHVENPCLNLQAATTPEWINEQPRYIIEGGFSSRTIYLFENKVRQRRLYYDLDWDMYEKLEKDLVHDLVHIGQLEGGFEHDSKETKDEMENWYQDSADADVDEKARTFRQRKHVHLHKVAMLLSIAERDDRVITHAHFKVALTLLDSVERKLPRVFSAIGKNIFGADMDSVRDYIVERGEPVDFITIHKRFYHNLQRGTLQELLADMVTLGWIKKEKSSEKGSLYSGGK